MRRIIVALGLFACLSLLAASSSQVSPRRTSSSWGRLQALTDDNFSGSQKVAIDEAIEIRSKYLSEIYEVEIEGEDVDSTGTCSAYTSHRFYTVTSGGTVTSPQWEFLLPLQGGGYQSVLTANTADFTIPAVQDADDYRHTLEGGIEGVVRFSGLLDGAAVEASYDVTLLLSPKVLSCQIVSIDKNPTNPSHYDVVVGFRYEGSHQAEVRVTEAGSSIALMYYTHTPYYATICLNDLRLWDDTYVDIMVENEYGSDIATLVVPAAGGLDMLPDKPELLSIDLSYTTFNYDINEFDETDGKFVFLSRNSNRVYYYMLEPWLSSLPEISWDLKYNNPSDTIRFDWPMWTIDSKLWIRAFNDNGSVSSDTICIKDFLHITDPDICRALGMEPTGVRSTGQAPGLSVSVSNGRILVSAGGTGSISSLSLYSLSGALVGEADRTDNLYVGGIPHGLYMLRIKDNNNRTVTKKIRL